MMNATVNVCIEYYGNIKEKKGGKNKLDEISEVFRKLKL